MSILAEWIKRNFTLPAVLAMVSTVIVSGVYIRVQGESIQQLQQGRTDILVGMKDLSDRLAVVERHGTDSFRQHAVQSDRTFEMLTTRVKDVESFNSSINVILTRLGYIESSLNELKRRP